MKPIPIGSLFKIANGGVSMYLGGSRGFVVCNGKVKMLYHYTQNKMKLWIEYGQLKLLVIQK